MPNSDKTGPQGLGPMTGNKMAYCTGGNNPGFYGNQGRKKNLGSRMKFGNSRGMSKRRFSDSKDFSQKEILTNELEILRDRMEFLESEIKKFD